MHIVDKRQDSNLGTSFQVHMSKVRSVLKVYAACVCASGRLAAPSDLERAYAFEKSTTSAAWVEGHLSFHNVT